MIDAEAEYEGKYAAADLYVRTLRARIGAGFPLSLAGFPYVDYHPAFPYSVFLGPGGATVNQPQMYWKDIGTSVREVFAHTYLYNRLWGRPIFPIGQTYGAPGPQPLRLFRRYSASYGTVPSWWDWQETNTREWGALGADVGRTQIPGLIPESEYPLLKIGAKGDLVVWAQERLITAGAELEVNGIFNRPMRRAVRAFQEAHGLAGDGQLGSETWAQLVDYTPFRVEWAAATPIVSAAGVRSARAPPGVGAPPRDARRARAAAAAAGPHLRNAPRGPQRAGAVAPLAWFLTSAMPRKEPRKLPWFLMGRNVIAAQPARRRMRRPGRISAPTRCAGPSRRPGASGRSSSSAGRASAS